MKLCGGNCEPVSELCAECSEQPVTEPHPALGKLVHMWLMYPNSQERKLGHRRVYCELAGGEGYTLLLMGLGDDPLESEIRAAALAKLRALRRGEVSHD